VLDAIVLIGVRRKVDQQKSLALIRLDAIGDFVIWLDAARHFRKIYPDARITLIANDSWVELAKRFNFWDEIIPVNTQLLFRSLRYRWRTLRQIRGQGFDIAIQPTYSRVFATGDSIIRATAASTRIGWDGDTANISPRDKRVSDRWYTRLLPAQQGIVPELQRNAHFIQHLTGNAIPVQIPTIPAMRGANPKLPSPYCILFPGASWSGKRWSAENFISLGLLIQTELRLSIIICGSIEEMSLCTTIAAGIQGAHNLAGQTDLVQLTEIIRAANLLVSNDTSAAHIAAAVRTPCVCILGGGHYGRFMPYPESLPSKQTPRVAVHKMPCFYCNWRCNQNHAEGAAVPCIANVTVMQVFTLAKQVAEI
jgi:ADP-heptose:LPS heptosyltransferase